MEKTAKNASVRPCSSVKRACSSCCVSSTSSDDYRKIQRMPTSSQIQHLHPTRHRTGANRPGDPDTTISCTFLLEPALPRGRNILLNLLMPSPSLLLKPAHHAAAFPGVHCCCSSRLNDVHVCTVRRPDTARNRFAIVLGLTWNDVSAGPMRTVSSTYERACSSKASRRSAINCLCHDVENT